MLMGRGGARRGAGRKRKNLLELVRDGSFYASKPKHRELLRMDDTLLEEAAWDGRLEELARLQAAFREAADSNPDWASTMAHRFERQVRFGRGLVVL
jgi:hypothetical protein